MSRIAACFAALQGKKALIPFITAGDPHPSRTVELMHGLVDGGADIIELGVPFSDPMADGPVIQRASERALVHKVGLRDVLAMVAEFRKTNTTTPVVLMGYLNPVFVMGYAGVCRRRVKRGGWRADGGLPAGRSGRSVGRADCCRSGPGIPDCPYHA
jgi:tryptophan synthase alpha chain